MRNNSYKIFLLFFCWLFLNQVYGQVEYKIDNPVLPNVRDVGVMKFNGAYYLGGMGTEGGFFLSEDLVNWEGPVHVFSMDNKWTSGVTAKDYQIHAGDINYVNGTFHFYWSVNHWGTDIPTVHVGHATSSNVLGPYTEPDKESWFTNRIDPHLFIDDDGQAYFYTVKFTDGNTIWGNKMISPGKISDKPKYLFASLPRTWETYDARVAEGPWVIKYRNKYYLMYNANHTSARFGNYALGVAEANGPLDFHNGNKYPYPVVESNQVQLEDNFVDVLKYSGKEAGLLAYTFREPSKGWTQHNFKDDSWKKGKAGFGAAINLETSTRKVNTVWNSDKIWIRKGFTLNENPENIMMRVHHDGDSKVYLNGHLIYQKEGADYTSFNFGDKEKSYLRKGENTLAIESRRGPRSGYMDVSLFDMKDQEVNEILYVPGQPSIVKGPNGFEWWLVYFTMKNGGRPGQFIDRVNFFNKSLYVDGPTAGKTAAYHPLPAKPTFRDNFSYADGQKLADQWTLTAGDWILEKEEVIQSSHHSGVALVKSKPSLHYLFQTGLKIEDQQTGKVGVYAYWKDQDNWLKVGLDQKEKKWAYEIKEDGKLLTSSYDLSPEFEFNVYHTLTIHKNANSFEVRIDQLPAPGMKEIKTNFYEKGIPGLYTEGSKATFDGVLYTIGWDEFDETIRGWESPEKASDEWVTNEDGLWQNKESGLRSLLKGDFLEQYDFSFQMAAEALESKGKAGAYPIYIDADNYLQAVFDYNKQALMVTGKKEGKEVLSEEVSLAKRKPYYADMRFSDFTEKHVLLESRANIDAIEFYKKPHFKPDTTIENIHQSVKIAYKNEGQWHPLTSWQKETASHPAFDKITFDPIKTDELRFENKRAESYVYKIFVHEKLKSSYNLRVAKQQEEVIFMVDGQEVLRTENQWPASQVGLLTEDMKANFNGIMRYHLP